MCFLSEETSALAMQAMSDQNGRGIGDQCEVEKEENEDNKGATSLTGRQGEIPAEIGRVTFGETGARCVCLCSSQCPVGPLLNLFQYAVADPARGLLGRRNRREQESHDALIFRTADGFYQVYVAIVPCVIFRRAKFFTMTQP